jgi:surface polysaccharide O-acyltransferase-like enzyme
VQTQKMQTNNDKEFWADSLRVFATVAVILLHVSAPIVYLYGTVSRFDWWVGNIVDSAMRCCVPLFLMLTGALILPKTYELGDFLKKRLSRILFPFIFYSVIYILCDLAVKWHRGVDLSIFELLGYIGIALKSGASYHLWYIYLIIGIYLFIPIISKWIVNSTKNEIIYYLVIWFVVTVISLPFLSKFKPAIELTYFSGFLGYPVLGYFLTTHCTDKKNLFYPLLLFIIGFVITIFGTYFLTTNKGQLDESFYVYLDPNVMACAIGVFLFFKQTNFSGKYFKNQIQFISKYSYGIYLAHVLVLAALTRIGMLWSFISPIIGIPVTTILCLTISSIICYILNKIPYGNYISG